MLSKKGILRSIKCIQPKIISVCYIGEWISLSGNDSSTALYNVSTLKPHYVTKSYHDVTTCLCISNVFKIHIHGTKDGSLVVSSIEDGVTIRVIYMNDEIPTRVMITPSWGFIVAEVHSIQNGSRVNKIVIFTINGQLIRKTKIDSSILEWTSWKSSRGFDYIAYINSNNKMWVSEAFYLSFNPIELSLSSSIISMRYWKDICMIVIATNDGKAILYPYHEEEW